MSVRHNFGKKIPEYGFIGIICTLSHSIFTNTQFRYKPDFIRTDNRLLCRLLSVLHFFPADKTVKIIDEENYKAGYHGQA